ncbi:MAG: penicillin-binding protein 2 [Calditrichaeota bacterium]|nr:penicillin-binding protein 2 [Calditrichota bacterium]
MDYHRQHLKQRQSQLSLFFIFVFVGLAGRFFYLQVYEQEQYLRASENNRIREVILKPNRGLIFDRNGSVLVENHAAYDVFVIPFEVLKNDTVLQLAAKILSEDEGALKRKIKKKQIGPFNPVTVKSFVDFETLSQIEEHELELPGVGVQVEPRRYYPDSANAAHLLGYVGEITKEEIKSGSYPGVRIGDFVGKRGLEKYYDQILRGTPGQRYVEVDALGREVRTLTDRPEIPPVPGKNLHISLDARLQRLLEREMEGKTGAAIVVHCQSGEILAMVSKPDYPQRLFSEFIAPNEWQKIVTDPQKPLFHRAIQSLYPPGSTYKLVLAAAALENGVNPFTKKFNCAGSYRLGQKTFDCWKPGGHGVLNLVEAIEQSCNVYFYQLSLEVGLDKWAEISRQFLFQQVTNIDLPGESRGVIPDREFLDKKYGKNRWTKGLILNQAIGQGDVLVTPLQMARLAMVIANRGEYLPFHLLRYTEDPLTKEREWAPYKANRIKGVSERTFEILRQAMWRVVNGENGTAKAARQWGIEVAGKTGTAENSHGAPHAWFVGFAPYENPEIAMCIIIENGGSGGHKAAPIASEIVKTYFSTEFSHVD